MYRLFLLVSLLTVATVVNGHCRPENDRTYHLPPGRNTVKLSLMNPGGIRGLIPSSLLTPDIKGTTISDVPSYSALIEHQSVSGEKIKILFDLGMRRDPENLPPVAANASRTVARSTYSLGDPPTQLKKNGIQPEAINTVIWSHSHFDHIGDMSLFPKSTSLIVGPGFKAAYLPGYPINQDSLLHQSDFDGRQVIEVSFASGFQIAGLPALDYFGDGSFYLISAPGHDHGHIAALARVTRQKGDDTFILLAGDSTHHGGAVRPTIQRPLPKDLPRRKHLLDIHPQHSPYHPFYKPAAGTVNLNATEMEATLGHLQRLDANPNVLTVISHDSWLLGVVELFPKSANQWRKKGWGDKTRWRFVNDFA